MDFIAHESNYGFDESFDARVHNLWWLRHHTNFFMVFIEVWRLLGTNMYLVDGYEDKHI